MTSSDEALKVLLGWKIAKTSLHLEFAAPDEPGAVSEVVQVVEAKSGLVTILVGGAVLRDFHFEPTGLELYEKVPQRFKNRFNLAVRISSVRGEEVVLEELPKI
jgi:hypothetical protein